ncbi:topoisomerase DNA-binding C4 zinc finger domain-containing protein [Vibrio sp. 10N.222.54.F12]|uniref:topoisomerase DNA-binding C4 zinc finger domain-containing protein n=1 Tax=Vibrio TaxID=662 RepID=UPI000C81E02F|nr:topoisomerase DNA-binding C4 zinc finger domain-containing protein [Vibrio tasmaniensis]PML12250.1 hypothetical protein BCT83_21075 [Vibrio tasmaniensis]
MEDVVTAINNISEYYYNVPDVYHDGEKVVETDVIKTYELNFVNAFSNQFSKITGDNQEYKRFNMEVEIPKSFMWPQDADGSIKATWQELKKEFSDVDMDKKFLTKPDFIFHADRNNDSYENQKLIVEAKVNSQAPVNEIYKDIFHTLIYANKYNFQYSVVLMINYKKDTWITKYKQYLENGYYIGQKTKHKNIYVIFKYSYNSNVEVIKLSDLFKEYTVTSSCENIVCLNCGSPMIKRVARSGFNIGNEFWGCKTFPQCRAVINIENT